CHSGQAVAFILRLTEPPLHGGGWYNVQRPFFEAGGRVREVQAAVSSEIIRLLGKHHTKSSGGMGLRHGEWTSSSWIGISVRSRHSDRCEREADRERRVT